MHDFTHKFIDKIWYDCPSFKEAVNNFKHECKNLNPILAAVIGRDIIFRRDSLRNREFNTAAFLASDGEAGNDRFLDFTDCMSILPEVRYEEIKSNYDNLIDDPISSEFDEHYLYSIISSVFETSIDPSGDADGLLDYLVTGGELFNWSNDGFDSKEYAQKELPRLYKKYAHLFEPNKPLDLDSDSEDSLADIIARDYS